MVRGTHAAVALAAALSAAAVARADDPARRGFDADPSRLALSLDGGFAVETAAAAPERTWRAGAVLDLANGLLVLRQGAARDDLLAYRLGLHLYGGFSLGRLELGAELPVALWQQSDLSLLTSQGVTGPLVAPIASAAFGDLRLGAKLPLLDAERFPVGLAALAELRLPTGDPKAFLSDGLALAPSLVATRPLGRLRLDAQLGYVVRGEGQYAQLVVHDGLTYGAGASWDLPPAGRLERWKAIAELTGSLQRGWDSGGARYSAPLEARAGLRAFLGPQLSVEAGGGTGLGPVGYGRERWRVFVGVRFGGQARHEVGPPEADDDSDGVPNATDRCPTEPGPPELDGCPDRDGDGIPDVEDRCPDQPGPAENEGCPVAEDEPLVEIETQKLSLKDSIHFDTARDTIKPESFPVLDQVATLLAAHPELRRIRVEGHTDNVGAAAYNKDLSARRAASVVRYLVGKGIAEGRLVPAGYGFERPIATNETALGRAKNRRVEFTILEEKAAP
ncbi:MAG TPA: OmpA family protein [Anaeromyxobacteraceae bacterium]|nr:OmpA family protein [Anaeromyxobacteraceae bacterium]